MSLLKKDERNAAKSYGIIGLGRFGMALAMQLVERGKEILVIDENEDAVREIREYTENAYVVKALDKKALAETGIHNCDVVAVCIAEKMDVSILVTLQLISMGIPRVIAKARSAEHGEILKKLGAEVVYPERDMAIRLARILEPSKIMDYIEINDKIDVSKFLTPSAFVGKTIAELDFRRKYGLNIIAIERENETIIDFNPTFQFVEKDIIFAAGDVQKITEFEKQGVIGK